MMKKFIFSVFLIALFFGAFSQAAAQSGSSQTLPIHFDMSEFPDWARDIRRFDIIAFGSFPFTLFFVNFFYDMYRWIDNTGMSFSQAGRQYAPWPLKSAGGVELTGPERRNVILISVGLSAAIALADFIIVKIRQSNERKRAENTPSGSVIIERSVYGNTEANESPP